MKIVIKAEVNETHRTYAIDLYDFGFTEEQWNELSEDEKKNEIENILDGMEQPYWYLNKYEEK